MIRKRPRTWSVLAAVAALAVLVGCGTTQAGAAAVVGDRRIPVEDVQRATEQIRRLQGAESVSQEDVLFLLIAQPYAIEAARNASVGVSEDDARSALRGAVADPAQPTVDIMRANLALRAVSQAQNGQQALEAVLDRIAAAAPRVNPRYGRYDQTQRAIVPVSANWIVPSPAASTPDGAGDQGGQPSPSASPTPTP